MVMLSRTDASGARREEIESISDSEFEPVVPARARMSRAQLNAELVGNASAASDADENQGTSSPSIPVMTGTHFHALDEKGRIIVPAKLRPALTEQFWMMLDENDNIGIYNYQTGLDILAYCESMMAENPDDDELAMAVQRTTEAMDYVTAESGWRVPIPEFLRFRAGLEKDVVTVGLLNHGVLWDRAKWEEIQATKMESPEVRRVQARMLRAAAAGAGLKRSPEPKAAAAREEADVAGSAADAGGHSGGAVHGGAEAASAGDGRRSPRVLTLSQLGKGR